MPDSLKAELIEGTVYLMSPPVSNEHSEPHFDLIFWLGLYCFASVGVAGADNGILRSTWTMSRSLMHFFESSLNLADSRARAPTTTLRDARTGCGNRREQCKLRPSRKTERLSPQRSSRIRCLACVRQGNRLVHFCDGTYEHLEPGADGVLRSRVFPGLALDATAFLNGDMARVNTVMQESLKSPEHAAFVERLKAMRSPSGDR